MTNEPMELELGMSNSVCRCIINMSWGQHGIATQFTRTVAYEKGRSPWSGVNDSVPIGYAGQATLRRE
jgi:hypothetical protein